MRKIFIITLVIFHLIIEIAYSQKQKKNLFKITSFSLQFAGSTGFLTGGIFKSTKNDKLELGLLYGYTPESLGGSLHSISFKVGYNPFKINLNKSLIIEPLQVGAFLNQNFGKDLDFGWPDKYPTSYYWWTPSLREHIFIGSSISLQTTKSKWLHHVSLYFEANTNDLYLASYFGENNIKSLSLYDITFFGTGLKFYLHSKKTKVNETDTND